MSNYNQKYLNSAIYQVAEQASAQIGQWNKPFRDSVEKYEANLGSPEYEAETHTKPDDQWKGKIKVRAVFPNGFKIATVAVYRGKGIPDLSKPLILQVPED